MSLLSRPGYRARQFFGALGARLGEDERRDAASLLGAGLMSLFESMSRRDQRHCFDVYRAVLARGCDDRDVLAAALLHDAGKGRLSGARVRLWHRVAYVVLTAGAPFMLRRLNGGRGGLAALHNHAARGAMLAEAMGATPAIADLIRRHEDEPRDARQAALRAADDSA